MAIALAGGLVCTIVRLPIPWLLGPMLALFAASKLVRAPLRWPGALRNAGMIVVGYSIGMSFTYPLLAEMARQLPTMLLMSVLLLLVCLIFAVILSRLAGISFPTALTGCIPGGLSQMIVLAEETKDTDLTVVSLLQITRLMMIVLCVPLLVFSPLFHPAGAAPDAASGAGAAAAARAAEWSGLFPNLFAFAAVAVASAWIGQRIKLPTAMMLGPLIGVAAVHLSGFEAPALPYPVLNAAQFLIGGYVGLLLKPDSLTRKTLRTLGLAVASGAALIAAAGGLSWLLRRLHPLSPQTSFLSLMPGGLDQMSLIAHEVGGNMTIVAGYQLFRVLFIFLVVSPLLKLYLHRLRSKERRKPEQEPSVAGRA
ncbi:MAG: AbrB family transcriptional regulator [Cohnella sp.]|nr:MAG: AbrB family transcriptional regulator [Cohnella sp.]